MQIVMIEQADEQLGNDNPPFSSSIQVKFI